MTGTYILNQVCNNFYSLSGSIDNYSCNYYINYNSFTTSDFIFYSIILPIVGIYLFFKFIRFTLDLFFK